MKISSLGSEKSSLIQTHIIFRLELDLLVDRLLKVLPNLDTIFK